MTDREKAIIMAYTGICLLTGEKFNIYHEYVEEIIGRPVITHEIALLADMIKEKSKADFIKICECEEHDSLSKERIISILTSLFHWVGSIESQYSTLLEECNVIQSKLQSLIKEVKEE